MIKVLLVYDDFNELTLTESFLKKIGFDVLGITNEVLLQEQMLVFRPDVVLAFGKSQRVNSISVGQKLKENYKFTGKSVIVVAKDFRPSPQDLLKLKMDAMIESPFQPEKLVQVLTKLTGLSTDAYIEKLQKSKLSEVDNRSIHVTGTGVVNPKEAPVKDLIHDPQRIKKYQKYVDQSQFDISKSTHNRVDIKKAQDNLKKDWDFDKLEEQDELKRQFAEALFSKAKK